MARLVFDGEIYEAGELSDEQVSVLDPLKIRILEELQKKPNYPSALTGKFDCSKQRLYYHFDKLEEASLIEEDHTENLSGGEATFYTPSKPAFGILLGKNGEKAPLPDTDGSAVKFLGPLIEEGELRGEIVVGSPDEHGPDQVWARDGHLSAEIAFKLGNYSRNDRSAISLDTEIVQQERFDETLLMIGGVLTNVVAKKFNESFPAYFPSEEFPYRELRTPENSYRSEDIGVIAKTSNPENREEGIFLVAGVQQKGTEAAVKAFSELEEVVGNYSAGQFYAVVKGLDLNSDGDIDDYRVIETSD